MLDQSDDAISHALMGPHKIYFDYNATTPLADSVISAIPEALLYWGNPSSIHWASREPKRVLRETRQKVASALGVSPLEIIFTSGGSESNNCILRGAYEKSLAEGRNEIITSKVEHPSVLKTLSYLESRGAVVHRIGFDVNGNWDWATFEKALSTKTAIVSVMFANNETGLLLPVKKIFELAKQVGAYTHTDAVQALGKTKVNLSDLAVDFASFSGHKFYSLKGTGVMFQKKGTDLPNLVWGGGQERARRGGTENILGIFSLGVAIERISQVEVQAERIGKLRDRFEQQMLQKFPDMQVTHKTAQRISNTSSVVIPAMDGESLLMALDLEGFAVSTGAACSSGSPEPSPTLLAFGLTREQAQSSLRVSMGWSTTDAEVDLFIEKLEKIISRVRDLAKERAQKLSEQNT